MTSFNMNSFSQTEAAIFHMQDLLSKDFVKSLSECLLFYLYTCIAHYINVG